MTSRRICCAIFPLIACAILLSSCTGGRRQRGTVGEQAPSSGKVAADAYLFDAKIHRHGKPTSIRLELYAVADTVYIFGRAYLGKGALKARLTADSITALFPTEREYLSDKVSEVMSSGACSDATVRGLHLARFLKVPPSPDSTLGMVFSEGSRPANAESRVNMTLYPADSSSCKWILQLDYDTRSGRRVLVRLQFNDGDGTKLNATLREQKPGSHIPRGRVTLDVPADYARLSPR